MPRIPATQTPTANDSGQRAQKPNGGTRAAENSLPPDAGALLQMQRTLGNRAVVELLSQRAVQRMSLEDATAAKIEARTVWWRSRSGQVVRASITGAIDAGPANPGAHVTLADGTSTWVPLEELQTTPSPRPSLAEPEVQGALGPHVESAGGITEGSGQGSLHVSPAVAGFMKLFKDQPESAWGAFYRRLALQYHPDKRGDPLLFVALTDAFDLMKGKTPDSGPTMAIKDAMDVADPEAPITPADPRVKSLLDVPGVTVEMAVQILTGYPQLARTHIAGVRVLLSLKLTSDDIIAFLKAHETFLARADGPWIAHQLLTIPGFGLHLLAQLLRGFPALARPHMATLQAIMAKPINPGNLSPFCAAHPAFLTSPDGPLIAGELLGPQFQLTNLSQLLTAFPGLGPAHLAVVRAVLGKGVAPQEFGPFCATHPAFLTSPDGPLIAGELLSATFTLVHLAELLTGFPGLGRGHLPLLRVLIDEETPMEEITAFCVANSPFAAAPEAADVTLGLFMFTSRGLSLRDLSALLATFPGLLRTHVPTVQTLIKAFVPAVAIGGFAAAHTAFVASARAPEICQSLLVGGKLTVADVSTLLAGFAALSPGHLPTVRSLVGKGFGMAEIAHFCSAHAAFVASREALPICGQLVAPNSFTLNQLSELLANFATLHPDHIPMLRVLHAKGAGAVDIAGFFNAQPAWVKTKPGVTITDTFVNPPFTLADLTGLVNAFPALVPQHLNLVRVLHAKPVTVPDIGTFCTAHPAFALGADAASIADEMLAPTAFDFVQFGDLIAAFPAITNAYVRLVKALHVKTAPPVDIANFCTTYPAFATSMNGFSVVEQLLAPPAFTLANLNTLVAAFGSLDGTHLPTVRALVAKGATPAAIGSLCATHTAFAASAEGPTIVDELFTLTGFTTIRLSALLTALPVIPLGQLPTVKAFARKNAPPADIATFSGHHPNRMVEATMPRVVLDLIDRGGTAATLDVLIGQLMGINADQLDLVFTNYLQGAHFAQISARVTMMRLTLLPAVLVQTLEKPSAALFQSMAASVQQGVMTQQMADLARAALNIKGWAPLDLLNFLRANAVRALLSEPRSKNPCFWIWQFARHHVGPVGNPDAVVETVVRGGRNVNIRQWILDHVNNRHTFEHFDFADPAAISSDRPFSTMLEVGFPILNTLRTVTNNPAVTGVPVWIGAQKIQVGMWEIRLAPDPTTPGSFRIGAFFPETTAPYPIPYAVMRLIKEHLFP